MVHLMVLRKACKMQKNEEVKYYEKLHFLMVIRGAKSEFAALFVFLLYYTSSQFLWTYVRERDCVCA